MDCSKSCFLIFTALVLSTAGFVLTITAWFAPPLSTFVDRVRVAGPVILLVGFFLMILSCILCSFVQGRCCACCYAFSSRKQIMFREDEEEENGYKPQVSHEQHSVKRTRKHSNRKPPLNNGRLPNHPETELLQQKSTIISPYPSIFPAPTSCPTSPDKLQQLYTSCPSSCPANDQNKHSSKTGHKATTDKVHGYATSRQETVDHVSGITGHGALDNKQKSLTTGYGSDALRMSSIGLVSTNILSASPSISTSDVTTQLSPSHKMCPRGVSAITISPTNSPMMNTSAIGTSLTTAVSSIIGQTTESGSTEDIWIPKKQTVQKCPDWSKAPSQQKVHPKPECVPCKDISYMGNDRKIKKQNKKCSKKEQRVCDVSV